MSKDSKEVGKMEEGKPQIIQINEGEVHAQESLQGQVSILDIISAMSADSFIAGENRI